jgi:hypothetical protein
VADHDEDLTRQLRGAMEQAGLAWIAEQADASRELDLRLGEKPAGELEALANALYTAVAAARRAEHAILFGAGETQPSDASAPREVLFEHPTEVRDSWTLSQAGLARESDNLEKFLKQLVEQVGA